jgi:hypothetical protein
MHVSSIFGFRTITERQQTYGIRNVCMIQGPFTRQQRSRLVQVELLLARVAS